MTNSHNAPAPTGAPELDRMVQYLRDRWAEERAFAATAAEGGRWTLNTEGWRIFLSDEQGRQVAYVPTRLADADFEVGQLIEQQNPHAVLADLDAKERLLGFLRPTQEYGAAVQIMLQRYAETPGFPPTWLLPARMEETAR